MNIAELTQVIASGDRENFTVSDDRPSDVCRVCDGTGWEPVIVDTSHIYGEGSTSTAVRPCTACKGGLAQRVKNERSRSAIPKDRSLSDFDWTVYGCDLDREKKIVDKFIERFPEFEKEGLGLFITSKTRGSGKTFLASAIGAELINRYAGSTRFVSASDLIEISKQKRDDGDDPLAELIGVRVLILDDLGQKATGTAWLTDILFRIIDKRYQAKRTMIVTSNVVLPELDFDDRIVDRLNAMTVTVRLPEFCVRAREANIRKKAILQELGVM